MHYNDISNAGSWNRGPKCTLTLRSYRARSYMHARVACVRGVCVCLFVILVCGNKSPKCTLTLLWSYGARS